MQRNGYMTDGGPLPSELFQQESCSAGIGLAHPHARIVTGLALPVSLAACGIASLAGRAAGIAATQRVARLLPFQAISLAQDQRTGIGSRSAGLGKGLGAGIVPISAVLLSQSVVGMLEESSSRGQLQLPWGHTAAGTGIGCSVARAVLKRLESSFETNPDRRYVQQVGIREILGLPTTANPGNPDQG